MEHDASQSFFFRFHTQNFTTDLDDVIAIVPDAYVGAAQAFKHNLEAVIATSSLPYQMALTDVQGQHFNLLHTTELFMFHGEQIERFWPNKNIERDKNKLKEKVRAQWLKEINSDDGRSEFHRRALITLSRSLSSQSFSSAAKELLRQGTVLTWSALEVLCRDTFIILLNNHPEYIFALIKHPAARKLFNIKGVEFDDLAEYKFNISQSLGNILIQGHDISKLNNIKEIFDALFPDSQTLQQALSARPLWLLNQRRHLIVHRRGIIDTAYIGNTGDALTVGQELIISPQDLETYLQLVKDAGVHLLRLVAV